MKYTHFLLLLLCLSAKTLLAQSPPFCAEMLDKAKAALKNKEYGKSRDYCEAALPLCPDFTDRFGKVLDEVNIAIEAEKKKAKDGEDKARRALAEQKKALANVVRLTLQEADKKVYILDYEGALEVMKNAAALNAAQKEVSDALLEIALFFAETGKFGRAKGVLDTAAQIAGRTLTLPSGSRARNDFRAAIKSLRPDALIAFDDRYFPTMLPIPGGTDTIGDDDEGKHAVTLSPFKMAQTETTWWQYNLFCEATGKEKPDKPGWGSDGDNPVINVSWYDAGEYANWLSAHFTKTPFYDIDKVNIDTITNLSSYDDLKWTVRPITASNGYRLPTEAEWEYAARAHTPYIYAGAGKDSLDFVAWYGDNSQLNGVNRTHPVAGKKANAFGLYDLSGNVWEWCWDWYGPYNSDAATNPTGAKMGDNRVFRGGSWCDSAGICRVSLRRTPTLRNNTLGFRLSLQ